MEKVLNTSLKVSPVDSTVVIQGETGVGKGFFAKLIHRVSKRKDGPSIRVDCGAIPESLVESELFGYEEGAFTGARLSIAYPCFHDFSFSARPEIFKSEGQDLIDC